MRAREEFRSAEHVLGKQVCPRYGHPRRARAPESQGKPGEGDQSGQPSQPPGALEPRQEMSRSTEAGAREEIAGLHRGLPGRGSRMSQRGRQCKRRPLWKILHSPQGWQTQKPWVEHAAKVNREWGRLWLCRAHINARKCLSFSFLVAKHFCMSAEPLICNPDGLSPAHPSSQLPGHFLCVLYTHTPGAASPAAPIWFACLFPVLTTTSQMAERVPYSSSQPRPGNGRQWTQSRHVSSAPHVSYDSPFTPSKTPDGFSL